MKKLMIIPGNEKALPAIQAAKELGLYVITADNVMENVGHALSDQFVDVSILDLETLLEAARNLGIDGILAVADIAAVPAAYVAEQLGLPCVGPYESVAILQNKGRFRAFLRDNGFNVPWAKVYRSVDDALQQSDAFPYPVIVKPTDSCGSRGVSVAQEKSMLPACVEQALRCSRAGEAIVEEFLVAEGPVSDSDCFSVDGELVLCTFSDERFGTDFLNPYTILSVSWPTTMRSEHQRYLESEIQRLLSLLSMGTGTYNIACMVANGGKPYIMECSPRPGGGCIPRAIEILTNVNIQREIVRAAVGLPVEGSFGEDSDRSCVIVGLYAKESGTFEELKISEEMRPYLAHLSINVRPGDAVCSPESARDMLGIALFAFTREDECKRQVLLAGIDSHVRVALQ